MAQAATGEDHGLAAKRADPVTALADPAKSGCPGLVGVCRLERRPGLVTPRAPPGIALNRGVAVEEV